MLHLDDYRLGWERKKKWYAENDFVEGNNLFTTADNERVGLDSTIIRDTAKKIKAMI